MNLKETITETEELISRIDIALNTTSSLEDIIDEGIEICDKIISDAQKF